MRQAIGPDNLRYVNASKCLCSEAIPRRIFISARKVKTPTFNPILEQCAPRRAFFDSNSDVRIVLRENCVRLSALFFPYALRWLLWPLLLTGSSIKCPICISGGSDYSIALWRTSIWKDNLTLKKCSFQQIGIFVILANSEFSKVTLII